MSGTAYKVIFSGEIESAADSAVVMTKLTERFKLSQEQAEALFSGEPKTIKKCRDLESAQKLARTLLRIGAVCRIVSPDGTPHSDGQDSGERGDIPSNGSSQEYSDMANDATVSDIVSDSKRSSLEEIWKGSSSENDANASLIKLEGNATPNLILLNGETVLLDLSQGWRDLGIMAKILGHKGRFIATNKRAIYFKKKTKDFDIQQLRMSHAGFVHMGHSLQFIRLCFGLLLLLAGLLGAISVVTNGQGNVIGGAIMAAIGGFMMWTARVQGLTLSGSGDKIVFATKSVSQAELSKILTVVNTG